MLIVGYFLRLASLALKLTSICDIPNCITSMLKQSVPSEDTTYEIALSHRQTRSIL
jgi:hypothetical protein